MEQTQVCNSVLKFREVERVTGYCRSSIYRLIGLGKFPPPIKLGDSQSSRVVFLESDINQWINTIAAQAEKLYQRRHGEHLKRQSKKISQQGEQARPELAEAEQAPPELPEVEQAEAEQAPPAVSVTDDQLLRQQLRALDLEEHLLKKQSAEVAAAEAAVLSADYWKQFEEDDAEDFSGFDDD